MVRSLKVVFSACAMLFLCAAPAFSQGAGRHAPEFSLQDTRDNTVSLSSYQRGQPLILFFWTTWCPYCRTELQLLNKRYPRFKEEGMEVLAINTGELPGEVEEVVRRYGLSYKVLLDTDMEVAQKYDVFGVPTYILIGKDGDIVYSGSYLAEGKLKKALGE